MDPGSLLHVEWGERRGIKGGGKEKTKKKVVP